MPAIIGENAGSNSLISWIKPRRCIPGQNAMSLLDNLSSHLVEKEKWVKQQPSSSFPLHSHPCLMAQSGRGLVQYTY